MLAAAGIVITPTELVNHVPLYRSQKDEVTTQYGMTALEDVGVLKMDFLGLRTLTVLNNAVQLVRDTHGVDIDWRRIPLDDAFINRVVPEIIEHSPELKVAVPASGDMIAGYLTLALCWGASSASWLSVPFIALFLAGYVYVGWLTLAHTSRKP